MKNFEERAAVIGLTNLGLQEMLKLAVSTIVEMKGEDAIFWFDEAAEKVISGMKGTVTEGLSYESENVIVSSSILYIDFILKEIRNDYIPPSNI